MGSRVTNILRNWRQRDLVIRWAPFVLHAAFVSPSAAAILMGVAPGLVLLTGGLCISVGYPILALMEARRAPLMLSPTSYFFAWHTMPFGLAAAWYGVQVANGLDHMSLASVEVPVTDVATGYVIALFGSWCLHGGMTLTRPTGTTLPTAAMKPFPSGEYMLLGAVGLTVTFWPGFQETTGQVGGVLANGAIVALSAYGLSGSKGRFFVPRFLVPFALAATFLFVLGLIDLSKSSAMAPIISILWAIAFRGRVRWALVPLFGAVVALYIGVVQPAVTGARLLRESEGGDPLNALARGFESGALKEGAEAAMEATLYRQFSAIPIGYIVSEVRTNGYLAGTSMEYLAYAWVPRVIWAEKPAVSRAGVFDYYVRRAESESALGQTPTGELYWNFGLIGVLIGMCLLGVMNGLVWRLAGAYPLNQPLHFLLYYLVTMTIGSESEAGTMLIGTVTRLIAFSALFIVISQYRSRSTSLASTWTR